jgi:hypothetical protein
MDQNQISSLRRAIASLARNKYKRRYPPALRSRLTSLVRAHPEKSIASLANTLGMAAITLEKIATETKSRIVPVEIIAEPKASSELIVRGPRGIVIEGFDVDSVAELIRVLS